MAVKLSIPYETLVELVEQLPEAQQHELLLRLLDKSKTHTLTIDERKALFETMMIDLGPVSPDYSDRREDWYGDDGR